MVDLLSSGIAVNRAFRWLKCVNLIHVVTDQSGMGNYTSPVPSKSRKIEIGVGKLTNEPSWKREIKDKK